MALTADQAKFEMRGWDEVSLPSIRRALSVLDGSDYVILGNNAGQGLPLAQSPEHAATIYADRLPEKQIYEQLGYRNFFRRRENGIDASDLVRCRGAAARALLHQYHSAQLA